MKFSKLVTRRRMFFFLICFVLSLASAIVLEQFYYRTSQLVMDIEGFSNVLHAKEKLASDVLHNIRTTVTKENVAVLYDDVSLYETSENNDLSFMVYEGDELLFWSNDIVDVSNVDKFPFKKSFFLKTNNTYCECIQLFHKKYRYVALIKIKDNIYPRRNSMNNHYAKGFDVPGNVVIADETDKSVCPIYDKDGQFLFSLVKTPINHYDGYLHWGSVVCWLIALLSLFFLIYGVFRKYKEKVLYLPAFLFISAIMFSFLYIFSTIKVPEILFSGKIFSPDYYASTLAPSFGHLVLYTMFIFACLAIGYRRVYVNFSMLRYVENKKKFLTFALQLFSSLLFFAFYYLSINLVYNSGMDVAVVSVREMSEGTLSSLFLIITWFFFWGLINGKLRKLYDDDFVSLNRIFFSRLLLMAIWIVVTLIFGAKVDVFVLLFFFIITFFVDIYKHFYKKTTFLYLTVLVLLHICMIVGFCFLHSERSNRMKYFTMTENLASGISVSQDRTAEAVMRTKNPDIKNDRDIQQLMTDSLNPISSDKIEEIIRNKYFDRLLSKYDIRTQVCYKTEDITLRKGVYGDVINCSPSFIKEKCIALDNTNFYLNTDELVSLNYIAVFYYGDYVLYVKFFPNVYYNRISFFEQMLLSKEDVHNLKLSLAKYIKDELLFVSGDYHYPNSFNWLPKEQKNDRFVYEQNGYEHYVYRADKDCIVIVSKERSQSYAYVIIVSYLFSFYLLVSLAVMGVFRMRERKTAKSLLSRMQAMFVIPLLFSSVVLGAISVSYFLIQYKKKQIGELSMKANSVQQNLQERLGESESFTDVPIEDLNLMLRDVSNLFHIDIMLYDKKGVLYSSSRTSFNLYGDRAGTNLMSPQAKFTDEAESFHEENKLGVDYLAYYVRAYNRKNVQVGYVKLLSSTAATQVKNDMMNILVVIVDIYLIIMMLSIFVIWMMNRRMTKPIAMMAERFKEIKLTGQNTKIEYKYEDEIGQLVRQYNQMVDELMVSAEKLAKSEREFAWREMARRIAHEIKNPLTPMKLSVQQAIRKRTLDPENFDEYFKKTSQVLIEQIDNLSRIASEFSNFAKTTQGVIEKIDIVEKISSSVALFENNAEEVQFALDLNGVEHAYVMADGKQMLQVFNNLFRNAIQAIPENRQGKINVSCLEENDCVLIKVQDNGSGVPEQNKENLFLPNFTTKTSGMGLGLAIVKNIINSVNGTIWFDSVAGVGSTFYIKLPLHKS
ncbi:MAG: HAMP domain-containing histidine kinase [Paludibacteraceae bacterium]|nr:HAMP domain-containing histidine kinase [Paludibacteraceae bacterium]